MRTEVVAVFWTGGLAGHPQKPADVRGISREAVALELSVSMRSVFWPFPVFVSGDFGHSPGFWADSGYGCPAFVEDQPVKIVGEVAKGQLCLGAGEADGADEQPEPALLMREDMLDVGADRKFGGIGVGT
ncbi:hypothetical protein [Bradyrhizobium sp.]|uniref:hypothetical protein n=1 Tax=Bradyrhizobium sp. TaxID=376 RepID=UPI00356B4B76